MVNTVDSNLVTIDIYCLRARRFESCLRRIFLLLSCLPFHLALFVLLVQECVDGVFPFLCSKFVTVFVGYFFALPG